MSGLGFAVRTTHAPKSPGAVLEEFSGLEAFALDSRRFKSGTLLWEVGWRDVGLIGLSAGA